MDDADMARRQTPVMAVFWVALIIRVAYCLLAVMVWHKPAPGGPSHDGYVEIAQSLVAGEGYRLAGEPNFFRPPTYVIFLLPWVMLPGTHYGILLSQSVLGAATCALITRILLSTAGRRNAVLGGLVLAICPWHVHFTANGMTPILAAFLTLTLIWLSEKAQNSPSGLASLWCGSNFGALALCHPSSVLIGPAWLVWNLLFGIRRSRLRNAAWGSLLFVTGTTVVMSPWVIRNWRATGTFLPLSNSAGFQAFVSDSMVADSPTWFSLPPTGIQSGMKAAQNLLRQNGLEPNPDVLSYKGVGMTEARVFDQWMAEHLIADGSGFLKRVFLQSWWFWFGDTPRMTVLHLLFKGLLLALAVRSLAFGACRNPTCVLSALVVLCFWMIHAVFMGYIPLAAYSLVAVGPLCILAFAGTTPRLAQSAPPVSPVVS